MQNRFANRHEAGRALAKKLRHYGLHHDAIVLALPRGGVPVGFEVSHGLQIPLEVFVVRKLGVPGHEEFAMGAIASGGQYFLNEEVVRQLHLSPQEVNHVIERETLELKRREEMYGRGHDGLDVHEKTVILIDDGLATGSSMRAAVAALRHFQPKQIIVAVPVAPLEVYREFKNIADDVVCVIPSPVFYAVGEWYNDFSQTTDEEVRELLRLSQSEQHASVPLL